MTKRLGIITPAFARGGSEEYVLALARHVRSLGSDVVVCLPEVEGVASVRDDLTSSGIDVESFPAWPEPVFSDARFLKTRSRIVRLIRQRALDGLIIVLPGIEFGGALIDAAALTDVPTVVVYQLVGYGYPFIPLERQIYSWARRQRQAWVVPSALNRDLLCESLGWSSDAVEVVHNGSLRVIKEPNPEERAAARASLLDELALPRDAHIVLTIGRLDYQKAYDIALAAAANVIARDPRAHYVWVGDGALTEDLTADIAKRGLAKNIHLLGRRTDVERLLHAADLFVLPSRFEGLPFAITEALQAGVPGVYSNIGPHAEIVRDGVEGLLVEAGDAAALASAVERLIAEPSLRATMGHAARCRASAFTAERHFARVIDLLEHAGEHPARQNWPCAGGPVRRRIAIYGAGEGGRRACAEALPDEEVVAFLDRDRGGKGEEVLGRPVLEPKDVLDLDVDAVVIASFLHYARMYDALTAIGYPADSVETFPLLRLLDSEADTVPGV